MLEIEVCHHDLLLTSAVLGASTVIDGCGPTLVKSTDNEDAARTSRDAGNPVVEHLELSGTVNRWSGSPAQVLATVYHTGGNYACPYDAAAGLNRVIDPENGYAASCHHNGTSSGGWYPFKYVFERLAERKLARQQEEAERAAAGRAALRAQDISWPFDFTHVRRVTIDRKGDSVTGFKV
jgi:hypothetical protein